MSEWRKKNKRRSNKVEREDLQHRRPVVAALRQRSITSKPQVELETSSKSK